MITSGGPEKHCNVVSSGSWFLTSDEDDGQGKVTPVAHLLAKD
jgi:hypothetical protein